jgi:Zn-dependent protease with chaperone function
MRGVLFGVLAAVMIAAPPAATGLRAQAPAPTAASDKEGVSVRGKSVFRYAVGAEAIEQQAAAQYAGMTRQAFQKQALAEPNDPQFQRLRRIMLELLPGAPKFNERAKDWKWEVNLIRSNQINAFCMPGGKIAFFTGIIEQLRLTDDEVAMVMGHEIGHALWEHVRERAGKNAALGAGRVVAGLLFGSAGDIIGAGAGSLAALRFSRNDELEADLIGMELAARAGYDPRSGITLWQKMSQASKGAPPQWLSTHPSGETRIATIKKHLPEVMGLYERARARRG